MSSVAPRDQKTVDARLDVPMARLEVVRYRWEEPTEGVLDSHEDHVLDLCLTPRPRDARARYRDHWAPHRFERLGGVFLVPAGHAMQARADRGSQASIICRLRSQRVAEWFDGAMDWNERRLAASLDVTSPAIRALLLRLGEEVRHPGFASEALVELMTAQLAVELSRFCGGIAEQTSGGLTAWRLKRIDERLAEPGAPPTLAELAQLCGLSVRQLTRGFRTSRGTSIGAHMATIRTDRACGMLAGQAGIKKIAHAMGFSSPSAFSYGFRRATGETPRGYRQRLARDRGSGVRPG